MFRHLFNKDSLTKISGEVESLPGGVFLFFRPFGPLRFPPFYSVGGHPGMIAFCSIYGDIFPATLDGGYSVGGGSPAIIVRGHDQK